MSQQCYMIPTRTMVRTVEVVSSRGPEHEFILLNSPSLVSILIFMVLQVTGQCLQPAHLALKPRLCHFLPLAGQTLKCRGIRKTDAL